MRALREHLAQRHRWLHSVAVARTAARFARVHGLDARRASLAGLLHDYARLMPHDDVLRECEARGLGIDAFERANPIVLHAKLGPELVRERFGIDDPAIASAMRKHTVADPQMSALDAVVYLADALEPGRDFPERGGFAALAERDLDAALRAVLAHTVTYLERRGLAVAPATLAALARPHPVQERRSA